MSDSEQEADWREKLQDKTIEKLLADPAAKSKLLKKLDLENLVSRNKEANLPEPPSESIRWPLPGQYPTPSEEVYGHWPVASSVSLPTLLVATHAFLRPANERGYGL